MDNRSPAERVDEFKSKYFNETFKELVSAYFNPGYDYDDAVLARKSIQFNTKTIGLNEALKNNFFDQQGNWRGGDTTKTVDMLRLKDIRSWTVNDLQAVKIEAAIAVIKQKFLEDHCDEYNSIIAMFGDESDASLMNDFSAFQHKLTLNLTLKLVSLLAELSKLKNILSDYETFLKSQFTVEFHKLGLDIAIEETYGEVNYEIARSKKMALVVSADSLLEMNLSKQPKLQAIQDKMRVVRQLSDVLEAEMPLEKRISKFQTQLAAAKPTLMQRNDSKFTKFIKKIGYIVANLLAGIGVTVDRRHVDSWSFWNTKNKKTVTQLEKGVTKFDIPRSKL